MTDKEFSLYEEEEQIILRASQYLASGKDYSKEQIRINFTELLDNYKKLFKQSKRLIRMSDRMEAELAITKAELEKYTKQLKVQATTDSLTGLANRRKITRVLEESLDELNNGNKDDFNIIMLDIDFFKKVNDNYGHPMGDVVIKEVSNYIHNKVDKEGIVGRFGGEEFLSILYNNDKISVFRIADQIRKDIEEKKIHFESNSINVTVSMGIASSQESQGFQGILDIADKRLYKAKENGRNQVVMD